MTDKVLMLVADEVLRDLYPEGAPVTKMAVYIILSHAASILEDELMTMRKTLRREEGDDVVYCYFYVEFLRKAMLGTYENNQEPMKTTRIVEFVI
ncbi:MAG: hypothetical protein LBR11_11835 [Deltaproteobacteria bacterium]|nr:hypothetical protein [Deltaproteobacteria bacterium]